RCLWIIASISTPYGVFSARRQKSWHLATLEGDPEIAAVGTREDLTWTPACPGGTTTHHGLELNLTFIKREAMPAPDRLASLVSSLPWRLNLASFLFSCVGRFPYTKASCCLLVSQVTDSYPVIPNCVITSNLL